MKPKLNRNQIIALILLGMMLLPLLVSCNSSKSYKSVVNVYNWGASIDTDLLAKLNTLDEDRMVINDYLGHKPSEVIGGMTTGVLVTLGVRFIYILLNLPL